MSGTDQSRFESSHALRMFPTFVWKAELDREIYQQINKTIVRTLADLRSALPEPEVGESWQSGHALHKLNDFQRIGQLHQ